MTKHLQSLLIASRPKSGTTSTITTNASVSIKSSSSAPPGNASSASSSLSKPPSRHSSNSPAPTTVFALPDLSMTTSTTSPFAPTTVKESSNHHQGSLNGSNHAAAAQHIPSTSTGQSQQQQPSRLPQLKQSHPVVGLDDSLRSLSGTMGGSFATLIATSTSPSPQNVVDFGTPNNYSNNNNQKHYSANSVAIHRNDQQATPLNEPSSLADISFSATSQGMSSFAINNSISSAPVTPQQRLTPPLTDDGTATADISSNSLVLTNNNNKTLNNNNNSFPPPHAVVCQKRLKDIEAKPRNLSPFDAKAYYPLLPQQQQTSPPPPPSLMHSVTKTPTTTSIGGATQAPQTQTQSQQRVTLALDIDETLVHAIAVPATTNRKNGNSVLRFTSDHLRSIFNEPNATVPTTTTTSSQTDIDSVLMRFRANSDFVVHIGKGEGTNEEVVFVKHRPHVYEFLAFAAERFEIVFFTASRPRYADPVLDHLLQTAATVISADHMRHLRTATMLSSSASKALTGISKKLRLYREHCADVGGNKVKDLSLLGRPLSRIVLVDNLSSSFMFQPRNGVHIKSWYGEPGDTELRTMLPMLEHLAAASDIVNVLDMYNATIAQ